jgi:hypothetical protein
MAHTASKGQRRGSALLPAPRAPPPPRSPSRVPAAERRPATAAQPPSDSPALPDPCPGRQASGAALRACGPAAAAGATAVCAGTGHRAGRCPALTGVSCGHLHTTSAGGRAGVRGRGGVARRALHRILPRGQEGAVMAIDEQLSEGEALRLVSGLELARGSCKRVSTQRSLCTAGVGDEGTRGLCSRRMCPHGRVALSGAACEARVRSNDGSC